MIPQISSNALIVDPDVFLTYRISGYVVSGNVLQDLLSIIILHQDNIDNTIESWICRVRF